MPAPADERPATREALARQGLVEQGQLVAGRKEAHQLGDMQPDRVEPSGWCVPAATCHTREVQ